MAGDRITASYARRFAGLRRDVSRARWTESTRNAAPHKPLLLLCVLDLFEQGRITSNLLELSPDLRELFTRYWTRILPPDRRGNLALPFFHLRSDGFWQLILKPGKQDVVKYTVQIRSLTRLQDAVIGARRRSLRASPGPGASRRAADRTYRGFLRARSKKPAHRTGSDQPRRVPIQRTTLAAGDGEVAESLAEEGTYRPAARDQGFRRAVVKAYAHCCALCGIRMLTLDGHTAVDASHIKPWSLSRDDRPANGMALCKLCHWSFDKGLLGISQRYTVMSSAQLFAHDNFSGHLSSLKGRAIGKPSERMHWPDPVSSGGIAGSSFALCDLAHTAAIPRDRIISGLHFYEEIRG